MLDLPDNSLISVFDRGDVTPCGPLMLTCRYLCRTANRPPHEWQARYLLRRHCHPSTALYWAIQKGAPAPVVQQLATLSPLATALCLPLACRTPGISTQDLCVLMKNSVDCSALAKTPDMLQMVRRGMVKAAMLSKREDVLNGVQLAFCSVQQQRVVQETLNMAARHGCSPDMLQTLLTIVKDRTVIEDACIQAVQNKQPEVFLGALRKVLKMGGGGLSAIFQWELQNTLCTFAPLDLIESVPELCRQENAPWGWELDACNVAARLGRPDVLRLILQAPVANLEEACALLESALTSNSKAVLYLCLAMFPGRRPQDLLQTAHSAVILGDTVALSLLAAHCECSPAALVSPDMLTLSVRGGDCAMTTFLLALGLTPNKDVLVMAAQRGMTEAVDLMLAQAPLCHDNDALCAALQAACTSGNRDLVWKILQKLDHRVPEHADHEALMVAAYCKRDLQMWAALQKAGCRTSPGALLVAHTLEGAVAKVKQALLHPPESKYLDLALSVATHRCIILLLLEKGADVRSYDSAALLGACCRGEHQMTEYLLKAGADVSARNHACLNEACTRGHHLVILRLLEHIGVTGIWPPHALTSVLGDCVVRTLCSGSLSPLTLSRVLHTLLQNGADPAIHSGLALTLALQLCGASTVRTLLCNQSPLVAEGGCEVHSDHLLTCVQRWDPGEASEALTLLVGVDAQNSPFAPPTVPTMYAAILRALQDQHPQGAQLLCELLSAEQHSWATFPWSTVCQLWDNREDEVCGLLATGLGCLWSKQ